MQPPLRISRFHGFDFWLRPNEGQQIGQNMGQQPCVNAKRLAQCRAQHFKLCLRHSQFLAQQIRECRKDAKVGKIGAELVELAAAKASPRLGHAATCIVDECGLADAADPRYRCQRALPVAHILKRIHQALTVSLAAVEPVWHTQDRRNVGLANVKCPHGAGTAQITDAAGKVVGETSRAGIAVVRIFCQQTVHDVRQDGGQFRSNLMQRGRQPCDMRIDQLGGVVVHKRQPTRRQLKQRNPQAVQIRAVIHRTGDAAALFRRHVRQRALNLVKRHRGDDFPPQVGRYIEVYQAQIRTVRSHDDVVGLDILVDDAGCVQAAQGRRHSQCRVKQPPQGKTGRRELAG